VKALKVPWSCETISMGRPVDFTGKPPYLVLKRDTTSQAVAGIEGFAAFCVSGQKYLARNRPACLL